MKLNVNGPWYHKLKVLRVNVNLSQAQIAEEVGVSLSSIIRYEKGDTVPINIVREKMAEILTCDVSELFGENPKRKGEK